METVSDLLRRSLSTLTPAEQRVVRVLLGDYPRAGLESASRLARRASTSAPTVVRLMPKLGLGGFPELQERLRAELAERAASPLDILGRRETPTAADQAGRTLLAGLEETLATVPGAVLHDIAESLCHRRDRVLIGGRFSSFVAEYLGAHLTLVLPRVRVVPLATMGRTAALLDVGPKTMVVAYDVRRYQRDTIEFCRRAKERGARVALFTDPWLSPAADWADVIVPCTVRSTSAFDSSTALLAATEIVIALVVERLGDGGKQRLAQFEQQQGPGDDRVESTLNLVVGPHCAGGAAKPTNAGPGRPAGLG